MNQIPRYLAEKILFALKNSPIVFVSGPRQAGKSTIVHNLISQNFPAEYLSFDNITVMAAATAAPQDFLENKKTPLIIDEVQMVPELFRVLKIIVDEARLQNNNNINGKFLLTGSANIMVLPHLSDPLVGRMSIKTLYPFAACEILQNKNDFIESLFNKDFSSKTEKIELNKVINLATFPEIYSKGERERNEWFEGYISTILQREVRLFSEIEKIAKLPILLRILAAQAGNLINDAAISRDLGLNQVTSKNYRNILQAMFLTFNIQPWYRNIGKRLVKTPKGYILDTNMLCYLLGIDLCSLPEKNPHLYGHLLENFVATELLKLLTFTNVHAKLLHFRTNDNQEVDFILERHDGTLAAIEVKAASTVNIHDFKGIKLLQELTTTDFICGIILYTGNTVVPFAKNLFAIPISSLWR